MKIIILSFTSDKVSRGVETVVEELSKRLKKKHEVLVISAQSMRMKVKWEKITKGNTWRNLMLDYYHLKIFWFTIRALKQVGKADILIAVNGGWQSLICRLWCWFTNTKLVIPGLAGLGWYDRWNLLMFPDVFVASTKRNVDWARKYNKRVRIEIIPHGVDLNRFKPEGKKIKIGLKRPVVLCVAAGEKYKRVRATIKAVAKLKKGSLLLVGGSDEDEKLGKKLLGSRFLRMRVKYQDLDRVYRSANVFTMVSESSEEFGIVNLEALASGLPVVATDDQLRREILGPDGIYVKNVWGKEYIDKLRLAFNKGDSFVKDSGKWLERFSWDRVAEEYEKVLESLI